MTDMQKQKDQVDVFRRLHSSGCFVMPNPWDAGSARALEQMGFQALATTSSGFAWTLGRADNQATLNEVLEHLRVIAEAVRVPVNADFEGGYAVDPQQVYANVTLAVATGIAGLSIEDSTGDAADPFDLSRDDRKGLSWDGPTLTRQFEGCVPMQMPAPIASTHPGSNAWST
jgi:2-methylisocitrate lyase-like PEP mutase family enzyme